MYSFPVRLESMVPPYKLYISTTRREMFDWSVES